MAKLDDMKKNLPLFGMLLKFSIKEQTDENILFYFDKGNMDGIYKKYIKPGSPKEINIDSSLRDQLTNAVTAKDEAAFKAAQQKARAVIGALSDQIITRFKGSPEYKFYAAREQAEKNAAKAMKVLGISTKGKDLLLDGIAYQTIGKKSDATKQFTALAKLEKLQDTHDTIVKNLKASGLL